MPHHPRQAAFTLGSAHHLMFNDILVGVGAWGWGLGLNLRWGLGLGLGLGWGWAEALAEPKANSPATLQF